MGQNGLCEKYQTVGDGEGSGWLRESGSGTSDVHEVLPPPAVVLPPPPPLHCLLDLWNRKLREGKGNSNRIWFGVDIHRIVLSDSFPLLSSIIICNQQFPMDVILFIIRVGMLV